MSLPLTKKVNKLLELLFEEPLLSKLARRLEIEAAENIPFHNNSKSADMDRIRFSILKVIATNVDSEENAFDLAKTDWRDLFVAAGFADDANEHKNWYRTITKKKLNKTPWWDFWKR